MLSSLSFIDPGKAVLSNTDIFYLCPNDKGFYVSTHLAAQKLEPLSNLRPLEPVSRNIIQQHHKNILTVKMPQLHAGISFKQGCRVDEFLATLTLTLTPG